MVDEMAAAIDIAHEAGAVVLSYFGSDRMDARAKGDRDVVTAADTASERLVLRRLMERFPGDGIVAEEGGQQAGGGARRWYVDPLDGTLNYSRGVPIWCVSLSLFEDDRPILGVVYDPIRRETFSAMKGSGAWLNGDHLSVSGLQRLEDAFVHLTIDFNDSSQLAGLDDIRDIAPRVLRTRNIGSAALALAYVAAGRLDAMIHRFAHPWDYGAGMLLIQEAGGAATAIGGSAYTAGTAAVLTAASADLHSALGAVLSHAEAAALE